jgi:ribosome biogenesis GTPase
VVIGDRVEIARRVDGAATIETVHPRESEVVRKGPGGRRPKVVAANVDRLVIVVAAARPELRRFILDRLLVIGEANQLESAVVLNKMDLLPAGDRTLREMAGLYREIGYTVLETSAESGEGLDRLKDLLCSGTSALAGPSGVGKSSLLNAIEPGLGLRTGELSHKQGRGKHTTVSARLIPLGCGGLVADTPGFSDVGVWGVDQRELEECFPDFHPFRESCQFRGCTHLHEPNCGVQDALERSEVDAGRFESYRNLVQEARGS